MPTHREILAELSTSDLAYLARRKPGSVRRQLEEAGLKPVRVDGRTLWWNGRHAFAALLERRDTTTERSRLDRARAVAQELKNAQLRGELMFRSESARASIALARLTSGRMQMLPTMLAPRVAPESDTSKCWSILDDAIRAALEELARAGEHGLKQLPELEAAEREETRRLLDGEDNGA